MVDILSSICLNWSGFTWLLFVRSRIILSFLTFHLNFKSGFKIQKTHRSNWLQISVACLLFNGRIVTQCYFKFVTRFLITHGPINESLHLAVFPTLWLISDEEAVPVFECACREGANKNIYTFHNHIADTDCTAYACHIDRVQVNQTCVLCW